MPRQAREKSRTGIYHIMLRGINRQTIFEDEEDSLKFLETLKFYKAISGYNIFAYCLMSNHIHILLQVGKEDLDLIMKRIAGSYVYWYNWKYYRKGHLFQDRYKSEPVEDEKYFLTVLRYIHQNPQKAGMVKDLGAYKFSSYNEILKENKELIDVDFVYSLIHRDDFIPFCNERNDDRCLEYDESDGRLSDADAIKVIQKISKCKNASEFSKLEVKKRDQCISKLKEEGLSIRQISRLTGISFGIVRRL